MNRADFQKLIGTANAPEEYLPVACLLRSGHGCAGFYSGLVNNDLTDTCVLLNARLVELEGDSEVRRRVTDFSDFIEDIVATHYRDDRKRSDINNTSGQDGGVIPLTAIPFQEISLVYPVAQIARLLEQAEPHYNEEAPPTFLDFNNKSIVLKALRTKLW